MWYTISRFFETLLLKILISSFFRTGDDNRTVLSDEQKRGLFSQMWSNEAFRRYLQERERYLIDNGMTQFIAGQTQSAKGLAGQLIEVRYLRIATKGAYNFVTKEKEEKKQRALTKG